MYTKARKCILISGTENKFTMFIGKTRFSIVVLFDKNLESGPLSGFHVQTTTLQ